MPQIFTIPLISKSSNTMEETNIEKIFSLEEIDYTRFWGDNDKILDFVRILFPKLKLIARGDMLKVVGSTEDIDHFDGKLQAMKTYYDKVGRLNENVIMQIFESGGSTPEAETNEEILVHGRNGLLIFKPYSLSIAINPLIYSVTCFFS